MKLDKAMEVKKRWLEDTTAATSTAQARKSSVS